jgi:hypothetical protein
MRAGGELTTEPRLADPRLPGHQEQTARTLTGGLESPGRGPQLTGPADELGEDAGHICHQPSITANRIDGYQVCDSTRHAPGAKRHALIR